MYLWAADGTFTDPGGRRNTSGGTRPVSLRLQADNC